MFEEVHEWCKDCLLRIDVVVENPRPVFEVAEDSTELPKGLVDVVFEPRSNHGFTLPCTPIRESPRHLVLSLLERVLCCPRE